MGIYPVFWSTYLLSKISGKLLLPKIVSVVTKSKLTGVDESSTVILEYESESIQAVLNTSMAFQTDSQVRIYGSNGSIVVAGNNVANPKRIELNVEGVHSTIELSVEGNGYAYEADHFEECLGKSLKESSVMGLEESLLNMKILDTIRQQHGIVYPGE